jgi:NDP-sugar pyrophosphorylase family protein
MAHAPVGMILSAGFGTRLYPLSLLRPKPIMELASKPIVYFLIKMLERAGIKDVILNLHYFPEQIKKAIEHYDFKCRIHFVYEKNILGTAGGIANALRTLNIKNRMLVVIHGDILCDIDLKPFLLFPDFCSLLCEEDREIEGYQGSVGIDSHGSIVRLGKFYASGLPAKRCGFFTGVHFLSAASLELIKKCDQQNLVAEVYPQWLQNGVKIRGIITSLRYDDLGSIERIYRVNMSLLKEPSGFCFLENFFEKRSSCYGNNIFIDEGVTIAKNSTLCGPLLIARGAHIDAHACVGPHAIIGENAMVKSYARVSNSVIMSRTTIEKDERIDGMIGLKGMRVFVKNNF